MRGRVGQDRTILNNLRNTQRRYKCEICEKSFLRNSALKAHLLIHDNKCEIDESDFILPSTVTLLEEAKYHCQVCGKSYFREGSLKSHELIHDNKYHKKYQCTICGKNLSKKNSVQKHMLRHDSTWENVYKCKLCHKNFFEEIRLKTHMLIHDSTRQKEYHCELCARSFFQKGVLKTHMEIHAGLKLYSCTQCNKKFSQKGNMETHMKTHSDLRNHTCPVCGKGFIQKGNMNTHIKVHHSKGENIPKLDTISKKDNLKQAAAATKLLIKSPRVKVNNQIKARSKRNNIPLKPSPNLGRLSRKRSLKGSAVTTVLSNKIEIVSSNIVEKNYVQKDDMKNSIQFQGDIKNINKNIGKRRAQPKPSRRKGKSIVNNISDFKPVLPLKICLKKQSKRRKTTYILSKVSRNRKTVKLDHSQKNELRPPCKKEVLLDAPSQIKELKDIQTAEQSNQIEQKEENEVQNSKDNFQDLVAEVGAEVEISDDLQGENALDLHKNGQVNHMDCGSPDEKVIAQKNQDSVQVSVIQAIQRSADISTENSSSAVSPSDQVDAVKQSTEVPLEQPLMSIPTSVIHQNSNRREQESRNGTKKSSDNNKAEEKPEITPDMEKEIMESLKPSPGNEVLCDCFRLSITRKDMKTLDEHEWVNDQIISFYLNLLMDRGKNNNFPSVYAFNTFFSVKLTKEGYTSVKTWTRSVDLFSFHFVLVPVYSKYKDHWSLVVIDFQRKEINFYDSKDESPEQILNTLKSYLQEESMDKKKVPYDMSDWKLENVKDIPQQTNEYDCGIFILKYAEYITRNVNITFSQGNISYFRRRMVYEILHKKLL